jgi:serine/threonine protein phosphatase 1
VAPGERVYAVGDVHGRADLLAAMLLRIAADEAGRRDGRRPRLVLLGDYIDRGEQSRAVLEMLAALPGRLPGWRVSRLRGNHEAALLDFLADPWRGAGWLRFGGLQTLASYGIAAPGLGAGEAALERTRAALEAALGPHRALLAGLPLAARSGAVVFAHAGLDPALPPDDQTEAALLWGRSAFPARGGPPGLMVVHGHYAAPGPVMTARRLCLDTGAYHSGRLSAARLDETTEILTVPA